MFIIVLTIKSVLVLKVKFLATKSSHILIFLVENWADWQGVINSEPKIEYGI